MRVFEDMIDEEVAARDHRCVSMCPGRLVYRPLYHGKPYTRGVEAEIAHWVQLAKLCPGTGRAVFVHFDEDVQEYVTNLPASERETHDQAVREGILRAIERRTGLGTQDADRLYQKVKAGLPTSSTLREQFRAIDVSNIEHELPEMARAAEGLWLEGALRGGGEGMLIPASDPRVLVVRAKDWSDFRTKRFRGVARFLSEGARRGWGLPEALSGARTPRNESHDVGSSKRAAAARTLLVRRGDRAASRRRAGAARTAS
jgi:hypothetical protein